MSGTVLGPAGPLAASAAGGTRLPRLWTAVGIAVAMHAALLALRPGGLAGSHVAPAAKAMAVRMVYAVAAAEPAAAATERLANAESATAPAAPSIAATREQSAPATSARNDKPARASSTTRASAVASRNEPAPSVPSSPAAPAAAMPGAAATALPAAPEYAFGVRLDPGPRPLDDIDPDYPDPHLREGTVVLRLLISESGRVDNVAVVRSEPTGVFEQAALDAFGKARFSPGLAAGTPVKSQITVEVRFVPINRGARVSGRTY